MSVLKNTVCILFEWRIVKVFENQQRETTALLGMLVIYAVIFTQNFLPTELSSPLIVLLGLSISIMAYGKIKRNYLRLVWPLLWIVIIGIFSVRNHQLRDILRDISFALTPISLIFIGYWMADNGGRWQRILKVIVTCGIVLAGLHLSAFIRNPALLSAGLMEVRSSEGAGLGTGSLVVLSIVLGLFQYRLGIGNLFPKLLPRIISLPVLLASFVLSYSRTEFMVALMLSLALWGLLTKINARMILSVVVLVIGFFAIAVTTPKDEVGTFRSKLARTFTEVTVSNYQDAQDINDNWRGFETYRVLASFSSGNLLQQMFGQGFGSQADLGFYMTLSGGDYRYIPVFHNGYAYILLKTGLLGLACYVFFYISVIMIAMRHTNSLIGERMFLARLLLGCILSLILVMFVAGGMAEMHESEFVFLLGYLARRIWQFKSENNRFAIIKTS